MKRAGARRPPRRSPQFVTHNQIDQVFITLPMSRDARIVAMLEALHDSTASIYFVPDIFAFNLIQARFDILGGVPVVAVRETPFYGAAWLVKRLSDVAIAVGRAAVPGARCSPWSPSRSAWTRPAPCCSARSVTASMAAKSWF